MKIDSWPQAIVITAGILATGGVVIFLVSAGWSTEAIVGFATLAAGLFAGQYANARKTSTVEAKTDQQSVQLDVIQAQTNGMLDAERRALAAEAAKLAVDRYVALQRPEET